MITSGRIVLCLLLVATTTARAQSIPGAVLARNEPHHHLAYQDSTLRVLRVRVPAHDTTLLHEHDPDYLDRARREHGNQREVGSA